MTRILSGILIVLAAAHTAAAQDPQPRPRGQEILDKLDRMRVTVNFRDARLEDALSHIHDLSGINIVVHPDVPADLTVTMKVKRLRLKSVLKLMLHTRGLTVLYRHGALVVVPKKVAQRKVKTRIYPVEDMLVKIRDFPGPKLELPTSGHRGGGG